MRWPWQRQPPKPQWRVRGVVRDDKGNVVYRYAPVDFIDKGRAERWALDWLSDNRWAGQNRWPGTEIEPIR